MPQLNEMKASERLKLLLFGDSGVGKTIFATSFPTPIYVADFDQKISSAAQFFKGQARLSEIDYDSYGAEGPNDYPVERFNMKMGQLRDMAKKGDLKYKTIVVDSLTTFGDEAMRYLMKLSPGVKRMSVNGMNVPSMADYGVARNFFKQFITQLISLPANIIVTAHIEVTKDEATGEIMRTPMLAGKLKGELPIYFEEVWRAYTDKDGKRWAQTASDSKYQARSQIKGIPAQLPLSVDELAKYRN